MRVLCALLALQCSACLTRFAADAANGVKNDLAVRGIASIDAAYVAAAPDPGLLLCGDVSVNQLRAAYLGSYKSGAPTAFVAFVPAAKLAVSERLLSYDEFYSRGDAPCSCLERIPDLSAIPAGLHARLPVVELVNPDGVLAPEATLEQQRLRVAAQAGLIERPVDLPLGPRGGNAAYWLLAPPLVAVDSLGVALLIPTVLLVDVGSLLYRLPRLIQSKPPFDPPSPEEAAPIDPCSRIKWLTEHLAPK